MAGGIRQPRGEATRTGIVNVARRLFADFGYHNTGISDIQAATGLTKGAFYHHFPAKQDVALAVLDVLEADYEAQLFGPAMAHDSPGRQLAALLDGFVRLNEQPQWYNCRLLVTLFAECKAADEPLASRVQALQTDMIERITQLIRSAQASGEAAPGSAETWAQWIVSTLFGLVLMGKTGAVHTELAQVVSMVKRSILTSSSGASPPEVESFEQPVRNVTQHEDADYF